MFVLSATPLLVHVAELTQGQVQALHFDLDAASVAII